MFEIMEFMALEISARALVAAIFLDWAVVDILALPIPTRTSSGAFLRAVAMFVGIPLDAGGFEAQAINVNTRQTAKKTPTIFFIVILLNTEIQIHKNIHLA
jgi:hypothetical protein